MLCAASKPLLKSSDRLKKRLVWLVQEVQVRSLRRFDLLESMSRRLSLSGDCSSWSGVTDVTDLLQATSQLLASDFQAGKIPESSLAEYTESELLVVFPPLFRSFFACCFCRRISKNRRRSRRCSRRLTRCFHRLYLTFHQRSLTSKQPLIAYNAF